MQFLGFQYACLLPFLSAWSIEARDVVLFCWGCMYPGTRFEIGVPWFCFVFFMSNADFMSAPENYNSISARKEEDPELWSLSFGQFNLITMYRYPISSRSGFKYMLLSLTRLIIYKVSISMPNECGCIVKNTMGTLWYGRLCECATVARPS